MGSMDAGFSNVGIVLMRKRKTQNTLKLAVAIRKSCLTFRAKKYDLVKHFKFRNSSSW